jgi:hypothetical protein
MKTKMKTNKTKTKSTGKKKRSSVKRKAEPIRISGKNLGAYAMPDACERCLWCKLKLSHRLPFSVFPGIFSSIDVYTKNVVHACIDRPDMIFKYLLPLGKIAGYIEPPHYSSFNTFDPEYGIQITGTPDGVLKRPDGSTVLLDYKTAKFSGAQDALLPIYTVQLNAYAFIADRTGYGPVRELYLVYFEPETENAGIDAVTCEGFSLNFRARFLQVDLQPEILPPLLEKVHNLAYTKRPPAGREGCKDCKKVDAMIKLLR